MKEELPIKSPIWNYMWLKNEISYINHYLFFVLFFVVRVASVTLTECILIKSYILFPWC